MLRGKFLEVEVELWKFEWQKLFMNEGRDSIDDYSNFIDQLMATVGSSVLKTKIF